MPDNKRQHYVPKATLKRFASDDDGKQLNIINISRQKIIRGASLRDQCYRDYLHGKEPTIERLLSELEGPLATRARKLIETETIDDGDVHDVTDMIALQRSRTLRAEDQANKMADQMAKLLAYGRIDEGALRKVRMKINQSAYLNIGLALLFYPVLLDLKQFLLINDSSIPFLVSDNPVVTTNWFGRVNYGAAVGHTGLALVGLQLFMPIAPLVALYVHDSSCYTIPAATNVIRLDKKRDLEYLNSLQWLNAYKNAYFSAQLPDEQIGKIIDISRPTEDLARMTRAESTGRPGEFRATDKDEYAAPTEGIRRELVHFREIELPNDIRITGLTLRAKAKRSGGKPGAHSLRDKNWCQVVEDYAEEMKKGNAGKIKFRPFALNHPLFGAVNSRVRRLLSL